MTHINNGGDGSQAGCGEMWVDVTYIWDDVDCPNCLKLPQGAAQQSAQADNNRRAEFWKCPKCQDLHGVEINSCGCGYCR